MPVRNAGDYLFDAVGSILRQVDVELELLLIDDGSTDRALDKLAARTKDPRIRYLSNAGIGLVDALNTGLKFASGDIVARMDADDIAHPQRLAIQKRYLQLNPDVSVCGCLVDIFADDAVGKGYLIYEKWINGLQTHEEIVREFFVESPIPHPSAMIRRSMIEQLGGYQDRGWPEDYDLWCRALLAGARFGKPTNAALLRWRDYPERTSRTQEMYAKKAFLACKAHYLAAYLKANGVSRCAIWGTGPTGLKLCKLLQQAQFEVSEFYDLSERMRGRRKRGLPVLVCASQEPDAWATQNLSAFKLPQNMLIVAVSARGARQQMRDYLLKAGLIEQEHFLFVA